MTKKDQKKLIKVFWKDAESDPSWMELNDILKWGRKSCECVSYGLLIDKNEENIVLASTKSDDFSDLKKIPIGMVSKIVVIKTNQNINKNISQLKKRKKRY